MKDQIGSRGNRWPRKMIGGILVFLFVISTGIAVPAFSAEARVVNGIVDRVFGRYLLLNGEQYDVGGVPVLKPAGNEPYPVGIRQGDTLELSIQEDVVISIRNYGPMLQ